MCSEINLILRALSILLAMSHNVRSVDRILDSMLTNALKRPVMYQTLGNHLIGVLQCT